MARRAEFCAAQFSALMTPLVHERTVSFRVNEVVSDRINVIRFSFFSCSTRPQLKLDIFKLMAQKLLTLYATREQVKE
ncbi:MAG: hypothetical protein ACLQBA_04720 [Candidatus Binataceae bacterium]